jgi:hypothetical protein
MTGLENRSSMATGFFVKSCLWSGLSSNLAHLCVDFRRALKYNRIAVLPLMHAPGPEDFDAECYVTEDFKS